MGGSGSTSSGTYTAPSGGYSSNTGIIAGAAAAAAAAGVLAYLILRNHGTMMGCVEQSNGETKLVSEKNDKSYLLDSNNLDLKAGERVKVKGKTVKNSTGQPEFQPTRLIKNYGSCEQGAR